MLLALAINIVQFILILFHVVSVPVNVSSRALSRKVKARRGLKVVNTNVSIARHSTEDHLSLLSCHVWRQYSTVLDFIVSHHTIH